MLFVVVNGPPGSGKSTLATRLAIELDWPLIAKDDIKEALGDALMWAVAARAPHAVLEGNFYPSAATRLRALDQAVLEVFCRCPLQVCRDRFERRLRDDNRHRVHPPDVPPLEFFEQFAEPIGIGPVLEVGTESHPDIPRIVEWINASR